MKRNWDLIRDVLLEVEELNPAQFQTKQYGPLANSENIERDRHAVMLWKAGLIDGVDSGTQSGGAAVIAKELTWSGHELLDVIRSKPTWEKIKDMAKQKGIELTVDAVIALGKKVLAAIING
jgi:hypothetical protein